MTNRGKWAWQDAVGHVALKKTYGLVCFGPEGNKADEQREASPSAE
jgi:hypothetical protein